MSTHFGDKSVPEHLKEARLRGQMATAEAHGVEMPGHLSAMTDAAKETALLLLLVGTMPLPWLLSVLTGWLVWKIGRSAWLGWSRLERLHRLIEEERWEIEHHRPQEKEELRALYAAKGFSGKLLEDVVEILLADDNRLLQVMLQEEFGLTLESVEHPLKQAMGAGVGVLIASIALFFPSPIALLALIALASGVAAYFARNRVIPAAVWNAAIGLLAWVAGKIVHGALPI